MKCEKCEKSEATTLVVDQPDYIHDRLAGWFMCEECFAADPVGWYEVLDVTDLDNAVPKKVPTKVRRRSMPRTAPAKPAFSAKRVIKPASRADDDLIAHAYELHSGGMKLSDVAREVMKVHPYKNVQSACASLRVNFKRRGWEMHNTRRSPVAA